MHSLRGSPPCRTRSGHRVQVRAVSLSLFLSLLTLCLVSPTAVVADELSIDAAINKAGMLRMLTQRITKSYLLVGHDVAADEAQKQLDTSVALFEENLGKLESYSPTSEMTESLQEIRQQWNGFRQLALGKPERDLAPGLINDSSRLLELCEKSVKLLENHSGDRQGELINLSGRQRMLSQRIGMLYVAKSWRVDDDTQDHAFDQALKDFDQALKRLSASPLNTDEINESLDYVSAQWEFSRSGFELGDSDRYVPFVIQVTTESILKKMDSITTMYATLENPRS